MNWEAIGAIGEVGGALAVVATLIYLARQIHSSAKATESQVHVSLSAEMERLTTVMAQDEFLSNAMLAAQREEELTADQELRLSFWYGGFMRVCESHFLQHHLRATTIDIQTPVSVILRGHAEIPFLRSFMRNAIARGGATREFLEWLDATVISPADA